MIFNCRAFNEMLLPILTPLLLLSSAPLIRALNQRIHTRSAIPLLAVKNISIQAGGVLMQTYWDTSRTRQTRWGPPASSSSLTGRSPSTCSSPSPGWPWQKSPGRLINFNWRILKNLDLPGWKGERWRSLVLLGSPRSALCWSRHLVLRQGFTI